MGLVSNQRRVQTRISPKTYVYGGEKNFNCNCTNRFFVKRGRRIIKQKCNRNCTTTREAVRFLQYIFPCTKEMRKNETHNKFETSQPVSQETTFQNGHIEQSFECSETNGLGNINRSNRCLFTHTNFSKTPKIFKVLCTKSVLPMENAMFWSNIGTKSVHQNSISSSCLSENTQYSPSSVFGRLVGSKPMQRKFNSRSRDMLESSGFTRFHNQQKEILSRPLSINCLSGSFVSVQTKNSSSISRQIDKFGTHNQNVNEGSENSQRSSAMVRNSFLLHRSNSQCSSLYETSTITPSKFLETKFIRFGEGNSYYTTSQITPTVVVKYSKHFQGQISATGRNRNDHNYRCISNRVWGSSQQSDSSRIMGQLSPEMAYQLSRDGSSIFDFETLSKTNSKQNSVDQMRQHNSSSVHKQTRGNKISSSLLSNLGSLELGNKSKYQIEGCTYSWEVECFSRSFEQGQDQTNRMDVEQRNSSDNFSNVGTSIDRHVCISSQSSNSNILYMVSSQSSLCTRCSDNSLGRDVSLCISPNVFDPQSSSTYQTIQLSGNSDSSILAKKALVHRTTSTFNSCAIETSKLPTVTSTTKHKNFPSKCRSTTVNCMASIDRGFKAKGFSKDTRTLLAASWRSGTQKDYTCKFKQFNSWCSARKIDPYSASLVQVASFLTDLYAKGLQYRTIAGYRSMLSSVLPPVGKISVGQHPYIIRLLKGVFNSRPPKVKLVPEWDLPKVLQMLQSTPFEPIDKASLKHLTFKTIFLIAITTFRRCSDLQALKLGEGWVNIQKKGVTFIRQGLAKQDRPNHYGTKIFVPAFPENKLLDPKRCLYFYLKKTEVFREKLKDSNKLFLSLLEPHQPVSSQTISKWIVQTIHMAYENQKKSNVKGHSTRALGPSWALFNGASVKSIIEAADWSKESTFCKFYLRDVDDCVPVLRCAVNK